MAAEPGPAAGRHVRVGSSGQDDFQDAVDVPYAWEPQGSPTEADGKERPRAASLDGVGDDEEVRIARRRLAAITAASKSGLFSVPEAPPQEPDHVPTCWVILLALPQLSMTSLTMLINVHLLSAYSRFGAPLALMTLFITIARSTDAITDPGVSWLTDNGMLTLCWRPGVRRKPFMLVGPLLYNTCMVLLLGTPIDFGTNGVGWAVWFGVVQTFFYLGDTLCSIPLSAMMPAMSTNSGTRESIFMWARGFNSLGILIAALAPVPLGWMLRADSCYARECAPCPVALPGANVTASGLGLSGYEACRLACETTCDVDASRLAFRLLGIFFAAWHLVTMYLVVFLVPEPGVEQKLYLARTAAEASHTEAASAGPSAAGGAAPTPRPGRSCCSRLSDRWAMRCLTRDSDPDLGDCTPTQEPLVAAFQKTLRNSAFVALVPATVLDMVAFTLIGTSMKLYVDYVVRPTEVITCATGSRTILGVTTTLFCSSNDVWLGLALFALMLSMIFFIPLWRLLSVIIGTRRSWLLFNLVGAVTTGLFAFAGEGAPIPAVFLSFINGIPQAAMFLNDAILSTTIDYDAVLNDGERAEARFSMFSSLTPKLASVPAQALPLSILAAIGFVEPVRGVQQRQPEYVRWYISAMFFIFPTVITLVSWLVKLRFPIRYQEQLDRISHNYRLLTGQTKASWHEQVLLRDPLDPSLAGSLSRERPWCSCCRPAAEPAAVAQASPVQSGRRTVVSRGKVGREDMRGGGTAVDVAGKLRHRGAGRAVAPAPPSEGASSVGAEPPRPRKHTIRLYPRVKVTPEDKSAFAVFDQFNVEELGAWRVFGLRFLREKTSRARCCRCTTSVFFLLAAAAQVLLGMLEQSAMSWLPTVTMLAFGLTLGLALMSHLKLQAVGDLNRPRCGGPSGRRFAKWLRANAMSLRLNALELHLVDESHSDAILQHEVEDMEAKARASDAGGVGGAVSSRQPLQPPPGGRAADTRPGRRSRKGTGRSPVSPMSDDARLEPADASATGSGRDSPRGRRFAGGAGPDGSDRRHGRSFQEQRGRDR